MHDKLTADELTFLASQNLSADDVYDARRKSQARWFREIKEAGKTIALGSPCRKAGHRLRSRKGHCVQCDTKVLAFAGRHDLQQYIYIAGSRPARLIKVGVCGDLLQRLRQICAERHGDAADWEILYALHMARAGEIEDIRAATGSANAAITSNQIAMTNSERQLRAYVKVQDINMVTHRLPGRIGTYNDDVIPGAVHTYRFSVILKNGGMTPAINARTNISHNRFNNEMPADFHFPDSANFGNALIGPQLTWHTPSITIPASELERPLVGAFHYLWGWIEYDDIFASMPRHRTEFCFKIECERLQPTNEFWVGFAPHSKFNAADNDCLRPIDPAG